MLINKYINQNLGKDKEIDIAANQWFELLLTTIEFERKQKIRNIKNEK